MPYKNPEDHKQAQRNLYKKNSGSIKARIQKGRHQSTGWVDNRYAVFQYAQGGLCYLCGESNYSQGVNKSLSADHCHPTTTPRGLLCQGCNLVLGRIESKDILLNVINYLS